MCVCGRMFTILAFLIFTSLFSCSFYQFESEHSIALDMSKVNKRKHVMKEMQTDDFDPPESNQRICRILGSRGNNLHEVESAEPFAGTSADTIPPPSTDATNATTDNANDGGGSDACCQFLVSMPTKFRKNVWVKRGDFVIAEPIDEGDKVKAEIVRILTAQHIKEFKKMSIWPEKFTSKDNRAPHQSAPDKNDSDNDSDLFVNTNRAHHAVDGNSEESSDSDSIENSDSNASDADSGEFSLNFQQHEQINFNYLKFGHFFYRGQCKRY